MATMPRLVRSAPLQLSKFWTRAGATMLAIISFERSPDPAGGVPPVGCRAM